MLNLVQESVRLKGIASLLNALRVSKNNVTSKIKVGEPWYPSGFLHTRPVHSNSQSGSLTQVPTGIADKGVQVSINLARSPVAEHLWRMLLVQSDSCSTHEKYNLRNYLQIVLEVK